MGLYASPIQWYAPRLASVLLAETKHAKTFKSLSNMHMHSEFITLLSSRGAIAWKSVSLINDDKST